MGRKRCQSPTSAHSPAAESVSIPRKQRSAGDRRGVAAVGDHLLERGDQRGASRDEHLDPGQVVHVGRLRAEVVEAQAAQPAHVRSASTSTRARPSGCRGAAATCASRWRARIRSPRQSSIARITSRNCSSATVGTNAKRNSPAASNRARRSASRLSVLIRSPDARGTLPAATTRTSIPRSRPRAPARTRSARPHRPRAPARQARQELHDLDRRHPQLHAAELARGHVKDRGMRLRRVHIKPDQGHTVLHGRHLPELGCRRQAHPAAQSPHISARGADRSTPQAGPDRPP